MVHMITISKNDCPDLTQDWDYLTEIANAWKNFDAPVHAPGMKMYTLITMGYHVGGLVQHFITKEKGSDFLEMALHHFVAFYLYFGYYMSNMWEI